ncbi:Carotene biosynthesis-related protein CBR, chloroplastic [Tetrabaena socialis]|uniref:Carotene biosynthesis-related protein CBR, chloroplastic n=1 Tax=Tetrabaena socialis TaxID=47790 RepID=A0A2J8AGV6_9CHLO|nr:Carotene biosynthesis-related protein CBR, chloroplastic [Tetrabaena socialis]|eukprot:PNH11726.1 Carotene biosynthesis-related protein CBR, chloroplastic [Tetrabaena socialis]
MNVMMQKSALRGVAAQQRTRRSLVCRAEDASAPSTSSSIKTPEWVPEQAAPVLKFLVSTDYKLEDSDIYNKYVKTYVDTSLFKSATGWKALPETINGRAAMLGFVAGAGAEIFGAGSILSQLSGAPQPVLVVLGLVIASSIIPIYKGTEGDYLSSLRDTYGMPEGVFTEANELLHGRLAMLGLTSLIAIEMVSGSALL